MLTDNQKSRINHLKHLGLHPKNILDIGAYRGNWATEIKKIFTESKVLMIEGNEENREYLRQIGLPYHISVLYKEVCEKEYYKCQTGCGKGNTIYKENTFFPFEKEAVQCNTLDNLLKDEPN